MPDLGEFSGVVKIIGFGFGGMGLFTLFMFFIQKFMRSKYEKYDVVTQNTDQELKSKTIQDLTEEQRIIETQLSKAEISSVETRKKVKTIARKAAADINKILKEDSISKIDKQIDSDWEKL